MNARKKSPVFLLLIGALVTPVHAGRTDTAFTYQGQLKQAGVPVTGLTDMKFSLYDAAGSLVGGPLIFDGGDAGTAPVAVENGLFSAELDFGADVFNGEPRSLAIEVRYPHDPTDKLRYVALTPLQRITAVPYALQVRGLVMDDRGGLEVAGDIQTSGAVKASAYDSNSPNILKVQGVECARFADGQNNYCYFGIGETNPMARLHIGGTPGSDGIMFPDGTLQTTAATGAGGTGFWAANGSDIHSTNLGNVGIGTTSPTAPLHIVTDSQAHGLLVENTRETLAGDFGIVGRGKDFGVVGTTTGTGGLFAGVQGASLAKTGQAAGIRGISNSPDAPAVHGWAIGGGFAGFFMGRGYFRDFVGIGRTTQVSSAEVFGIYKNTNGFGGMYVQTESAGDPFYGYSAGGDVDMYHYYSGEAAQWRLSRTGGLLDSGTLLAVNRSDGHVGIGTINPSAKLHVLDLGPDSDAKPQGGGIAVFGSITGGNVVIDGNEIMARNNGSTSPLYLNHDGGDVYVSAAGTGKLIVKVVQITGADVAEKFPASETLKPGVVVEIDPDNPGSLRISRQAYNRRVAGVVSGAGGLSAGAILGNLPGYEDAPAIALSGRVWVHCDAGEHAIEPGDLLTTSNTPGHARKVTDYPRAQGAILGKAMTPLSEGTGMVMVLVTLQ